MKFSLPYLFLSLLSCTIAVAQQPATAEAPVPEEVQEEVADYIRYVPAALDGDPDILQSAVSRFTKDGVTVDLVSAVHLADAEYFKNMNALLKDYDAVLYELVGGKFQDRDPNAVAGGGGGNPGEPLAGIGGMQSLATRLLGLEFQLEGINYEAPNFVHADIDWKKYEELSAAKNETMSTLLTRAMTMANAGGIKGLPADEAAMSQMLNMLMTALMSGDSATLKRTIAPFLSQSEALIAELEGDDGTVLVSERNKVVMAKLKEVIGKAPGQKGTFAIFYGAGHMPDLENRLLAEGYSKGEVAWANAWEIKDTPPDPNAGPPVNLFQELLGNNPEILNLLQELGKAMEAAP